MFESQSQIRDNIQMTCTMSAMNSLSQHSSGDFVHPSSSVGGPEKRATAMSLPTALSFEAQKTAQGQENGWGGAREE